jgi:hypothetical protein
MKTSNAHRSTRPDKEARRERRKEKHGRGRPARWKAMPIGGTVDPKVLRRTLAAMGAFDPDAPWTDISSQVLPLIKRLNHAYPAEAAPIHLHVPPGIWTGFGIDFGPAFSHISARMIERWAIEPVELLATSIDNLRRRADESPPIIEQLTIDGVRAVMAHAHGWGSALVLAPDLIGRFLDNEPRFLLAPIRNTLVALPTDVDIGFVAALWGAIADGNPDELDLEPLRWTGSTVVATVGDVAGLVN